jgi:deoxyuridine 5'-triphosphate nucleotidohydrolase
MFINDITNEKTNFSNPTTYHDLLVLARVNVNVTIHKSSFCFNGVVTRPHGYHLDPRFKMLDNVPELYKLLVDPTTCFRFFDKFEERGFAEKFFVAAVLASADGGDGIRLLCNDQLKALVYKHANVPFVTDHDFIVFEGVNYIDLDLYDDRLAHEYVKDMGSLKFLLPVSGYNINVKLVDVAAVLPSKKRKSDAGLDVTLVKKIKTDEWGTFWYDTGIQLEHPLGYYSELVGRSSLIKKGWQLANCVGVIDESYRGNVIVAVTRLHPLAPELELPSRACQLIVRRACDVNVHKVTYIGDTDRGADGFGSTG